ncbi:murein L,D-transpeptidase catalytic domain family protein [Sphingomonas sp. SCN 67-18]|uniref:murein L,D-transpeptidase catalytic domain family protein n=1 Tax=uncultured Sphingomonas sp. TaxID=158754 RepID=UPI000A66C569|nr:murein L,D-transpeptidase catalytic domain family protein [Sphingomonas sp. SCN 67-18]
MTASLSRRQILQGAAGVALGGAASQLIAALPGAPPSPSAALLARAEAALDRHGARLAVRDRFALADFSAPSRVPRFHLVDRIGGRTVPLLVAHGRGSDPAHSGWVERFSNEPGSLASSEGAYLAGDPYTGRHGRSRRLIGLDASNSNAETRAIVIHAAWYVGPDMVRTHGKLGRSEGCFAFAKSDLDRVMETLTPGTLLFVGKA